MALDDLIITECDGKGALDANHYNQNFYTASKSIPSLPTPRKRSLIPYDLPDLPVSASTPFHLTLDNIHPHMRGMMSRLESQIGKTELIKRMASAGQVQSHAPPLVLYSQEQTRIETPQNGQAKFINFRSRLKDGPDGDMDGKFMVVEKADPMVDLKTATQRGACPKCQGVLF